MSQLHVAYIYNSTFGEEFIASRTPLNGEDCIQHLMSEEDLDDEYIDELRENTSVSIQSYDDDELPFDITNAELLSIAYASNVLGEYIIIDGNSMKIEDVREMVIGVEGLDPDSLSEEQHHLFYKMTDIVLDNQVPINP